MPIQAANCRFGPYELRTRTRELYKQGIKLKLHLLIQTKDQTHLWAKQYDRELSNLLTLQGEIAQEIADGIQLTLGDHKRIDSAHQASLSAEAYEAYDLYLKGRYFWNKRTTQGFQHDTLPSGEQQAVASCRSWL